MTLFLHGLVAVVGLLVVAAESDDGAEAGSEREEDLRGGVHPHLDLEQAAPVLHTQVERDAQAAALQRQATNQQDEHYYVGRHGCNPYSLHEKKTTKRFSHQIIDLILTFI